MMELIEVIEVEVETTPRRISLQLYEDGEIVSFIVSRLLSDDTISIRINKNIKLPYSMTPAEAREYADILSLLAETAEMVARTITKPGDFGKGWAARLVDGKVVLDEVK